MRISDLMSPSEQKTLDAYLTECYEADKILQGKDIPYYGAIGGEVTYTITPTSLGYIFKVKYGVHEEVDITDYDRW